MVIEGFGRDADLTAMDIGHFVLLGEDEVARVMEAIRAHVFPQARAEATEYTRLDAKYADRG